MLKVVIRLEEKQTGKVQENSTERSNLRQRASQRIQNETEETKAKRRCRTKSITKSTKLNRTHYFLFNTVLDKIRHHTLNNLPSFDGSGTLVLV